VPPAEKKTKWGVLSRRAPICTSKNQEVRRRQRAGLQSRHTHGSHQRAELGRRRTLLWVDDYEAGLILYKAIFEQLGFRVLTASEGRLGLDLLESHRVDAVITDYEMPGMDGGKLATHIKNSRPELPVLMFSGCCLIPDRVRNIVDGVCDKAGSREELMAAINRVIEGSRLQPAPVVVAAEAQRTPQLAGAA
jgi:DNA-binding NtrC family response regulator